MTSQRDERPNGTAGPTKQDETRSRKKLSLDAESRRRRLEVSIANGGGLEPLENGALILEGNRILNVGAADMVQPPTGAEVIDVKGKTIMPTLISESIPNSSRP